MGAAGNVNFRPFLKPDIMLRIGLTGGIGAGKTTVSDKFHKFHNIPVIDADQISHSLMQPGSAAYHEIIAFFGPAVLLASKQINRKYLREKIFLRPESKKTLEDIMHPKVRAEISNKINQLNSHYCLVVIPLLIESGMQSLVDRILLVETSRNNQIRRVSQRDHCAPADVENILNNQADAQTRRQAADEIIDNNTGIEDLDRQIYQLHKKYLALRG